MYIFRDRDVFIDVYKADDKVATSGATLLSDLDLQETYRALLVEYLLYPVPMLSG